MIYNFLKKHKDFWKQWLFYFGIIFISYMMFMHFYITSDYVPNVANGGKVSFPNFATVASGGRFFTYILLWFYYFLDKISISYYQNAFVLQILGIMVYAYGAVVLSSIFLKCFNEKRQRFFVCGAVILAFVNPFMVETYVYGCFEWAVGIVLAIISSKYVLDKKYIVGMILALCGTSIYQTNIVIVLIISAMGIFLETYEDKIHTIFLMYCKLAASIFAVIVTNVLIQKITVLISGVFSPGKEVVIGMDIWGRIGPVLRAAMSILIEMHGMLPSKFLPVIVLIIYICTLYVLIIKEKKLLTALIWTLLIGGLFLCPFAYGLIAKGTQYAARIVLSLFFAIGMYLVGAMYIVIKHVKLEKLIFALSICFLGVTYFYTEACIVDCYKRQALDFNEAACIQDEIREYEETTGNEIITVITRRSNKPVYYSNTLFLNYDITYNYRIMHDDWAQTKFLNYVSGENYESKQMSEEEYERYFDNNTWEVFNPSEQLHFEGNTLYWAIY